MEKIRVLYSMPTGKKGFELAYCTNCNRKKMDPNQNTISSAHLEAGIVHVQNFDKKAQSAANLNLLINQKHHANILSSINAQWNI